jgi:hypothetical protein
LTYLPLNDGSGLLLYSLTVKRMPIFIVRYGCYLNLKAISTGRILPSGTIGFSPNTSIFHCRSV